VTPLLDQLLLPGRLLGRALDDAHRMADAVVSLGELAIAARHELEPLNRWMQTTASELKLLREHAAGVQWAIEPMVEHVRILRDEFGRANDEIARLRKAFGPELAALREQAGGIRSAIEPMVDDVTILRDEFARANTEIGQLGDAFAPQLVGLRSSAEGMLGEIARVRELLEGLDRDVREIGDHVTTEISELDGSVRALVRDADEISDVVEPLQAATDRVGRVADRLPGGSRRKS
jgi:predicted  nucleic acid-binding Zn-ribbon protein